MRILITGGSGFIGQPLCAALVDQGHRIGVVSRSPDRSARVLPAGVDVRSSVASFGDFEPEAVINLAGEPIAARRWSAHRKKQLIESRTQTTEALVDLVAAQETPPAVFISASAVGYYGRCGQETVTEESPPGEDFSHQLCAEWEQAAQRAKAHVQRLVRLRIGLVFDQPGGMLDRVVPPFKLGLGAPMGSGQQFMPWVHRVDVVRAIEFLLDNDTLDGAVNLSAPTPVDNLTFSKTLAQHFHRPMVLRLPEPMLRVMFGEMADLLVYGARMVPEKLSQAGFRFQYPDLTSALRAIFPKR